MIEKKLLDPFKLSEEDIFWIEKGCTGSYDKATAKDQISASQHGNAWIFRLSGDVEGIFVLAKGNVKEKELVMTAMAGKNIIKHFPQCYGIVKELAKSVGTKRLIGYVSRAGLAAIYRNRTKAKLVASLFAEDLT